MGAVDQGAAIARSTTSDNISAIEAVEKALNHATAGPWHDEPGTTTGRIVLAPKATKAKRRVGAFGGPDREANAAYIAACNPVAMSAILAEARKAEAMKREIAELRADFDTLDKNVGYELSWGELDGWSDQCGWRVHRRSGGRNDTEWTLVATGETAQEALRRARTLLNGGSDAQG